MRLGTDVALPEVKKVHVVDGCLAPLDLKDDPRLMLRKGPVVIRSKARCRVVGEQPLALAVEAQRGRLGQQRRLDQSTGDSWLVHRIHRQLHGGLKKVVVQKPRYSLDRGVLTRLKLARVLRPRRQQDSHAQNRRGHRGQTTRPMRADPQRPRL